MTGSLINDKFYRIWKEPAVAQSGHYTGMCRTAGVPVQFRTKHLLNTSSERHDHTKLFYAVLSTPCLTGVVIDFWPSDWLHNLIILSFALVSQSK
jgi:hypothetical protein